MLSTFASIRAHVKFRPHHVSIDNLAFKFHYRATFLILLICTVLVTSRQYIGEHIRCISGGSVPDHVINTFCFFTTTFTVVRHFNESMLQSESLPHPGIGPSTDEDPIRYHAYYQWVPFVLFAQALMFYLPHLLWRSCEGGKLKLLVDGLQMISLSRHLAENDPDLRAPNYYLPSPRTVSGRVRIIKNAFVQHVQVNRWWANRLVVCEFLNLANLALQVYVTDRFLGGQFYALGVHFVRDDFRGIMDTLDVVFPKVTKCHFHKYGPSGTIQKIDALCVMALNVINEKIFVFLWFWYWVLAAVSVAAIVWRMLTMVMHSRSTRFNGFVFAMACPGRLNPWDMLTVTQHSSFSDWVFLYYLAKNMEPYLFRNMLIELANELRESEEDDANADDVSDYDGGGGGGGSDVEKIPADVIDDLTATENDKNAEVNLALLKSKMV